MMELEQVKANRKPIKTKQRIMAGQSTYFILTVPALLLYTVFFAYPVVMGFYYSLTNWDGLGPKFNFIGLKNYIALFQDPRLLSDLRFTVYYSILFVVFGTVLSLAIALFLNSKSIRFKNFFRSIYFFPAVLSMITVGLIWNEIYFGALPELGKWLGIPALSTNILGKPHLALYGILLVNLWQGAAVPMVIFLAGLQSIPQHLYEAATIDGATLVQKFVNVTFPFLIPIFNVVMVINVTGGLTVFDYIMAMTNGGPGYATESIGLLIYNNGFSEMKFGYGAAESILLLVIIASISIIQITVLRNKEAGQQ